jgi:hypothetical protein
MFLFRAEQALAKALGLGMAQGLLAEGAQLAAQSPFLLFARPPRHGPLVSLR